MQRLKFLSPGHKFAASSIVNIFRLLPGPECLFDAKSGSSIWRKGPVRHNWAHHLWVGLMSVGKFFPLCNLSSTFCFSVSPSCIAMLCRCMNRSKYPSLASNVLSRRSWCQFQCFCSQDCTFVIPLLFMSATNSFKSSERTVFDFPSCTPFGISVFDNIFPLNDAPLCLKSIFSISTIITKHRHRLYQIDVTIFKLAFRRHFQLIRESWCTCPLVSLGEQLRREKGSRDHVLILVWWEGLSIMKSFNSSSSSIFERYAHAVSDGHQSGADCDHDQLCSMISQ